MQQESELTKGINYRDVYHNKEIYKIWDTIRDEVFDAIVKLVSPIVLDSENCTFYDCRSGKREISKHEFIELFNYCIRSKDLDLKGKLAFNSNSGAIRHIFQSLAYLSEIGSDR